MKPCLIKKVNKSLLAATQVSDVRKRTYTLPLENQTKRVMKENEDDKVKDCEKSWSKDLDSALAMEQVYITSQIEKNDHLSNDMKHLAIAMLSAFTPLAKAMGRAIMRGLSETVG